jgi:hypothetical protein
MKTYTVDLPFVGYITLTVEAENEEQAKELAFDTYMEIKTPRDMQPDGVEDVFVGEFDFVKQVIRGNVCYAPLNDMSIEEVEE